MNASKLEQYKKTYEYELLCKKHHMYDHGVWCVRGEDPNCEMSGTHHMPVLVYVVGALADVIESCVELPGFWQWGSGGSFTKIEIQTITDIQNRDSLIKKKEELEKELTELKVKLGESGF